MGVTKLQVQPATELRLRVNAQRACDLVIRIVADGIERFTCAAYAPRRQYDRAMVFAVAEVAECRISGELVWIGSACFTLTASELTRFRDFVSPRVLRETP